MMCTNALLIGCVLAILAAGTGATLPSYIHTCKRNDPHLEDCILSAVEKLRPQLVKGISELDVPALEPLVIPEIVAALGNNGFRAVANNVLVKGGSKFKVNKLKVDLKSKTIAVGLSLDVLTFTATYDADLRIGSIPIKASGPFWANATGIDCECVLHGKLDNRNGVEYLIFPSVDVDLEVKDMHVRIENLFPDKALTDANNALLNENSREIIKSIRPITERTVGNVIIDTANKITRNIPYDELFPLED